MQHKHGIPNIVDFIRYNGEKGMTIKAYIYAAYFRWFILRYQKKNPQKFRSVLGQENEESSTEVKPEELKIVRLVSRHVSRVAGNTPWESKCLVQAMTAQKLLNERKIETTLYLGVGYEKDGSMRAHSWLRYGNYCVTGGGDTGCAVVAKFKK